MCCCRATPTSDTLLPPGPPSLLPTQVLGDNPFDAYEDVGVVDDGVLMDGFAPPPGATYCMFPDEQDLLVQDWDPYGAKVDTADLRQDEGGCGGLQAVWARLGPF